jgi:putative peptide zinc metalloprotease protein
MTARPPTSPAPDAPGATELEWLDREIVLDSAGPARSYLVRSAGGKYLRLSPTAFRLLQLARGRTVEEVAEAAGAPVDAVRAAYAAVERKVREIEARGTQPYAGMWLKFDVVPARWVNRAAALLTWAFRPGAAVAVLLLIGAAALASAAWGGAVATSGRHALPAAVALFGLSLLVHELGHAAACLRYGAAPSAIGVGFYIAFPILYSDVSAAWSLSRRQRAVVDLGGIYLQSAVGALYLLLHLVTGWAPFQVAVAGIVSTVVLSMNPLLRFDGYWVVSDLLGIANLHAEGRRALRHVWDRLRRRSPPALPWPGWVVALVAAHSTLSTMLFAWFMVRVSPFLVRTVSGYPGAVRRAIAGGGTRSIASLLGATLALVVAGAMVVRLGRRLAGFARRLRPRPAGGDPPDAAAAPPAPQPR